MRIRKRELNHREEFMYTAQRSCQTKICKLAIVSAHKKLQLKIIKSLCEQSKFEIIEQESNKNFYKFKIE